MERKFHGSESSLYGLFALRNESAEERKGLESEQIHTAVQTLIYKYVIRACRLAAGIARSPVSAFQAQRIARSICGLRNHRTTECKKSRGDQGNTNNMVCF